MDSANRDDDSERRVDDLERQGQALAREYEEKQRLLDDITTDILRQMRNILGRRENLMREQRTLLASMASINSGTVDTNIDNSGEDSDDEDSDPDEDIPKDSARENTVTWNNAKPEEKTSIIYDTCCACLDETPAIFNIPCGHVCLCEDCNARNVGRNECPFCRKVIKRFYVMKRF